ncbi:aldehyde dehydrogenase family protein [Hoeflea prorocentri]|uniref:Aldehyde dehydrogenase family protein n=1 Tax=Hoeflea prorocentri TaxID=1922333 RepID=A0A9X3UEG3_9HYPH|nr:aldehyde dehydrogenase family protein [Hoeflea prorocentri]MCY6379372.1 aldehyde dehydrogenase family protein [Hoeflea prorocentri]MDA5397173.1 aldehyde dehydrogenase family protein [Hoeflea prorocentri]
MLRNQNSTISFDPADVDLPKGHWIDGAYVDDREHIELRYPSNGATYAACPIADPGMVDRAVQSAKHALKTSQWATCRPRERAQLLQRWADLMEEESERLGQLEALASTRPISQAISVDVAVTAEQIRFFAEFADKEGGDVVPTDGNHLGMILTEPYGIVGAITPWNVPLSMAGWKLGPALAAGNAVVLKPSEMTPFSTLYLAELATRAGIPSGIVNIVLGDGPTTGASLVGHSDIAKISFTGSTVAGGAILKRIADTGIKPMTLELGGKSPQVVFRSADIERTATAIARGIQVNAGQTCVAGSRIIVQESVAPEILERVTTKLSDYRIGATWVDDTNYSPIISETQLQRIDGIVKAAIAKGASCAIGGKQLDHPGYFYEPTILTNLDSSSPALSNEIFGPVVTIQTFVDEEEAYELANHPTFGLAAGVYSSDLKECLRATKRIEAGTVWVNRYGRSRDHILPTGGFKASGIGKDLGREAYKSSRRQKSVLIEH